MSNRSATAVFRRVCLPFAVVGVLVSGASLASDQEGCLLCHRLSLRVVVDGAERNLKVDDRAAWIHEALFCSDCHPDARNAPHPAPPGAAQCIGECHGGGEGAISSHRRAAFGGLTETHRRVSPGKGACLPCHRASDAKTGHAATERRCDGCHSGERAAASRGPHARRADSPGFCSGCHPPHPALTGKGDPTNQACAASDCHARVTPAMKELADHRTSRGAGSGIGKAALFFLLACAGWLAGSALSPKPGRGEGGT